MNEQALKDSYELFKQKGYTKSFDEYVNLINTNPNALNDSYSLFKEQGYGKSIEEFSTLVGVKKKDESVSIVQEDVTESITPEVQEEVISSDASYQRDDSITDNDYLVGLSNGSIKTNEGSVATITEVIAAAKEQGYPQEEIDSLMVASSSDPTDSISVSDVSVQEDKPNWKKQIDEFGESASIWNDPSAAGVSTEEIREYYLSTQQPESVPTDSTLTEQEEIIPSDVTETIIPKKRKGVRLNFDEDGNVVGESTHLMKREFIPEEGWVAFPSLFQDEDGAWIDMSNKPDDEWHSIYKEAKSRGEVYNFGTDKQAAIDFADKGSWKSKTLSNQESTITTPTADVVEEAVVEQAPIPTELDQQIYQGIYGRAIEQGGTPVPTIEQWMSTRESSAKDDKYGYVDAEADVFRTIANIPKTLEASYDKSFPGFLARIISTSGGVSGPISGPSYTGKDEPLIPISDEYATEPIINITDYKEGDTNEYVTDILSTVLDIFSMPNVGIGGALTKVLPKLPMLGVAKYATDTLVKLGLKPSVASKVIKKQLPKALETIDKGGSTFALFETSKDFQRQVQELGGMSEVDFTQSPEAFAKGYGLGAGLGLIGQLGRQIPKLTAALRTEGRAAVAEKGVSQALIDRGLSDSRIIGTLGETIGLGGEVATFGLINATTPTLENPEGELTAESFSEGMSEALKYIIGFRAVGLASRVAKGQTAFNKQYSEFNKAEKEQAFSLFTEINNKIKSGELTEQSASEYLKNKIDVKITPKQIKEKIKSGEITEANAAEYFSKQEVKSSLPITLIDKVLQEISGMKSNLSRKDVFNKVFEIEAQAKTDGTYRINTYSKDGLLLTTANVKGPAEVSGFINKFKKVQANEIEKANNGQGNYPVNNKVSYTINPVPLLESKQTTTTVDGDDITTTTNIVTEEYAAQKLIEEGVQNATPEEVKQKQQELLKEQANAIQEPSTETVDVQEQTGDSQTVGEGDTEVSELTTETTQEVQESDVDTKTEVTIEGAYDEYGDIDYEAASEVDAIAKKRDLGITSDREIASIARDSEGNIIGGAYTSYDNTSGEYTFDVVVDERFDGKGVGSKLLNEVIEIPFEIQDMNPDAKVVVDVVNPQMQSMLEARGFEVIEKTGPNRVKMSPKLEVQESDVSPEVQAEIDAIEADERIDLSELDAITPTEEPNSNLERIQEFYDGEIEGIQEEITLEQGNTKEGIAEIKSKIADVRKDKSLSKDERFEAIEDLKAELEDFKQEQRDVISTYKDDIRVAKAEMKADIKEAKKSTPEFRLKSADETQVDAIESAKVTDVINEIESPNKEVQLAFQSSSSISVDGLNKRTDTPLNSTTLKVVDGIPTIFTITDQLTTGNTVNPETGNTIDNLKGAVGFNGTKGHENFAWANLGVNEGNAIISKAVKVAEDNPSIFEKWWKENPEYNGLVPMNVVKMGEGAMISNEATFRVLADNISTLPTKNRKAALSALKREVKSEIKKLSSINKPTSNNKKDLSLYRKIQSEISNVKATSIEQVLSNKFIDNLSLAARVLLSNKITYGSVGEPGLKTKTPGTPNKTVTKALLEGQPKESRRKLNLGFITDVITDPELRNVPIGNIVALVGVDVLNPQVLETTHPNYKYGVKGKSIGVLENPVPMEKAYPKTYEKSFKVLIDKESKGMKASGPTIIAQQSGVGMGIASLDYVGAMTSSNSENVNKLVSFLNESFPSVTLSVDSKKFNDIMNTEGVKKYLKGDEVVYGVTVNGDVYVNPEVHNSESALFNTAIHEMGHIWTDYLQTTKKGREMYAKGVELVKETDTYREQLEIFNGDEAKAANEALAILIGNKGETITDGATNSKFKEWLLGLWNYIKKQFKQFKDLTSKEIQDLTLDQFLGTALRDILSGKPIKLTPKQRAAMKADVAFRKMSPSNKVVIEKVVKNLRSIGYSEVGISELLKAKGFNSRVISEIMAKVKKVKKEFKPDVYIKEAREANFTDERIMNYLTNKKGINVKDVKEMLSIDGLPNSFANIKGGAKAGLKLFKRVNTFRNNLISKNKATKKNKLSEAQITDKIIQFLEKQPEYKNESEGKIDLSTTQAKMITEFQRMNTLRQTQAMRAKLATARRDIKQRAKGAKDVKTTQDILKSFIRKTIPVNQYTKTDVLSLINKITKAEKASIDNLINEVFEFAIAKNVKTLNSDIKDILNIKTEELQSGRLKGVKVDSDTAKLIKLINKSVLTSKSTADEIEASNEIERKKINELSEKPKENISEIMARTSLIGINNSLLMDNNDPSKVDALDVALENLEALVKKGKSELAVLIEAQKTEYNKQFEEAYLDITGQEIDMSNPDSANLLNQAKRDIASKENKKNVQKKLSGFVNTILGGTRDFFYSAEALQGLMDAVSKMPGELFGGKMQELVTDKIDASTRRFKERRLMYNEVLTNKFKDIYGKKWKSMVRSNAMPTTLIESIDMIYSQNQLYYLYNQFKDPANLPAFKRMWGSEAINKKDSTEEKKRKNSINKSDTERVAKEIESKLDPKVKEFADWQVNEYFPSLYEYYNSIYKKIYRTDMPWNEFYAGRIYRDKDIPEAIDLLGTNSIIQTSVGGSSTKSRINNTKEIMAMDGTDALMTYLNDMEFFAAYAESVRDINKIFTNPNIKAAIESNHGKALYTLIQDRIQQVANQGTKSPELSKFINRMNNVFITTRVALSPVIFLKQMTSAITYSSEIGFKNYTKYSVKNKSKMIEVFKEIKNNSVYMKNRGATNIMRVIESYSDSAMKKFVPNETKDFFIDAMMFFVRTGDKGAIYIGGMPLYSYYKAKFKDENPNSTEQEAIDYAILKFEKATKTTQQSEDIQDKDYFQTGDAIVRGLNAFKTTPKQYLRREIMAIRNLYRKAKSRDKNAGKGTLYENVREFTMFHMIMPAFFQWVSAGLPGVLTDWDDEDDQDMIRAMLIGNLNALFILGEVIGGLGDLATGKPWASDIGKQVGILELSGSIIKKIQRANQLKDPEKKAQAQKELYAEMLTLMKIPAPQLLRMTQNAEKISSEEMDSGELILRLLNYSEYVIKGRGKNKKKGKGDD